MFMHASEARERSNKAQLMFKAKRFEEIKIKFISILNRIAETADKGPTFCDVAVSYNDNRDFFELMLLLEYSVFFQGQVLRTYKDIGDMYEGPNHTIILRISWKAD